MKATTKKKIKAAAPQHRHKDDRLIEAMGGKPEAPIAPATKDRRPPPKMIQIRTTTDEKLIDEGMDSGLRLLMGALETGRWGMAHRVLVCLEGIVTGHSVADERDVCRNRAGETPMEFSDEAQETA